MWYIFNGTIVDDNKLFLKFKTELNNPNTENRRPSHTLSYIFPNILRESTTKPSESEFTIVQEWLIQQGNRICGPFSTQEKAVREYYNMHLPNFNITNQEDDPVNEAWE